MRELYVKITNTEVSQDELTELSSKFEKMAAHLGYNLEDQTITASDFARNTLENLSRRAESLIKYICDNDEMPLAYIHDEFQVELELQDPIPENAELAEYQLLNEAGGATLKTYQQGLVYVSPAVTPSALGQYAQSPTYYKTQSKKSEIVTIISPETEKTSSLHPFYSLAHMSEENQKFVKSGFTYDQKAKTSCYEDGVISLAKSHDILRARADYFCYRAKTTKSNMLALDLITARSRRRFICKNGGRFTSQRCGDITCLACQEYSGTLDGHGISRYEYFENYNCNYRLFFFLYIQKIEKREI